MVDRAKIGIDADASKAVPDIKAVETAVRQLGAAVKEAQAAVNSGQGVDAAFAKVKASAKELAPEVSKLGGTLDDTTSAVERLGERTASRLAILALFHEALALIQEEVTAGAQALEEFEIKTGLAGRGLVEFDTIVQHISKTDPLKLAFEGVLLPITLLIQRFKEMRAAEDLHSEGLKIVTKDQADARVELDALVGASLRFSEVAKAQVGIDLELANTILKKKDATDAEREAIRTKLTEDEKALKKYGVEYPAALQTTIDALRNTREQNEELAKVIGGKTPEAIDKAVSDLAIYVSSIGDAATATREQADAVVKTSEALVKAIEQQADHDSEANRVKLDNLHTYLTEFERFTTKYAKETDKQAAASKRLADQEARDLDTRRKNYESYFKSVSAGLDKLQDATTPKGSAEAVAKLRDELNKLRQEQDTIQSNPETVDQLNQLDGISAAIIEKQRELDTALKDSAASVNDLANQAGPALGKVTDFLNQTIIGGERFAKIFAELSPDAKATVQDLVDGFQRTAYNADLAGKSISGIDVDNFRRRLADAFKGGGGEAAQFASEILASSNTIQGAFGGTADTFDRLNKDATTIVEGERAVGEAFKATKPDIDAETDSLNANTNAKEANAQADGSLVASRGPKGVDISGPTGSDVSVARGPGGTTISNTGAGPSAPTPLTRGTANSGTPPLEVTTGDDSVRIALKNDEAIKNALETLRKDGLLPAADAVDQLNKRIAEIQGPPTKATQANNEFLASVGKAHGEAAALADQFDASVKRASETLGNETAEFVKAKPALDSNVSSIQDVVAASIKYAPAAQSAADATGELAKSAEDAGPPLASAAASTQEVAAAAQDYSRAVQDTFDPLSEYNLDLNKVRDTQDLLTAGVQAHVDMLTALGDGLVAANAKLQKHSESVNDATTAHADLNDKLSGTELLLLSIGNLLDKLDKKWKAFGGAQ